MSEEPIRLHDCGRFHRASEPCPPGATMPIPARHRCWVPDCEVCRSDRIRDDWLTDASAVIHRHHSMDDNDDEFNDWAADLAAALWDEVGPSRLMQTVGHLIGVGDTLHDMIAPATDHSTADQLDMWNDAVMSAREAVERG